MVKVTKKMILAAITVISLIALFSLAWLYKKPQVVNVKPVTVQKIVDKKPLASFSPSYSLKEFIQFNKEFDTLFQRNALYFNNLFSQINDDTLSATFKEEEEPNQFIVSINLAGINPKNINLSIQNRTLCVITNKKSSPYFYYRFLLPGTVDSEKITAKAKYGILKIIIPKSEKMTPKSIVIKEE
ncbi:MAG: Hsp20/alpha crystallin family protein [Cellulomonas sp.]|nr:Hsp20/alpha crystallin family protein [Rickettsiella sp.]